jgi:geranylgeranyl diphosphate synthase type I
MVKPPSITDYRGPINNALTEFFGSAAARLDVDLSEHSEVALERLREYTMRSGKRIRGSLASASYDAVSGETFGEAGLQLGVALELIQSYLLIVDDVMDRSEVRRGKLTLHEQYAKDTLVNVHEADMMAINVGLLAQHFANMVVLDIDGEPNMLTKVLGLLHHNTMVTGFGQLDDLFHKPGRDLTEADVLRQYTHKSSYYTFVNPLQLGLVLAGKDDDAALQACIDFGKPAGVAFQLHDDMLGIFADTADSGKPNLDDIREGKYTLLMHYALERADAESREGLQQLLGNGEVDEADLERVRVILIDCGAKEYVQKQIEQHTQQAFDALEASPIISTSFSDQLRELVHYATTRQL